MCSEGHRKFYRSVDSGTNHCPQLGGGGSHLCIWALCLLFTVYTWSPLWQSAPMCSGLSYSMWGGWDFTPGCSGVATPSALHTTPVRRPADNGNIVNPTYIIKRGDVISQLVKHNWNSNQRFVLLIKIHLMGFCISNGSELLAWWCLFKWLGRRPVRNVWPG